MDEYELAYREVVEGLRLAASPFDVQRASLPDFVHLPDEILLAVDDHYVQRLIGSGRLAAGAAEVLRRLGAHADAVRIPDSYDEAVSRVESHESFETLRHLARESLAALGEEYRPPDLGHVAFVPVKRRGLLRTLLRKLGIRAG